MSDNENDSEETIYYSDEDQIIEATLEETLEETLEGNSEETSEASKSEQIVWYAFNNIQYHIIKTATGYDTNTMFDIYTDLDTFKLQPENKKYVSEINRLIKKFNIKKYEHHLEKLCKINNGYYYPSIINIDELWDACIELEHKLDYVYNNINIIYDTFQELYPQVDR